MKKSTQKDCSNKTRLNDQSCTRDYSSKILD